MFVEKNFARAFLFLIIGGLVWKPELNVNLVLAGSAAAICHAIFSLRS